jgi:hypothetical protein
MSTYYQTMKLGLTRYIQKYTTKIGFILSNACMCKVRQKEVVGATCFKDTCPLLAIQSLAPRGIEGHRTSVLLWYDNQK